MYKQWPVSKVLLTFRYISIFWFWPLWCSLAVALIRSLFVRWPSRFVRFQIMFWLHGVCARSCDISRMCVRVCVRAYLDFWYSDSGMSLENFSIVNFVFTLLESIFFFVFVFFFVVSRFLCFRRFEASEMKEFFGIELKWLSRQRI